MEGAKSYKPGTSRALDSFLTVLFGIIAIAYVTPIAVVLINSFKEATSITTLPFALPTNESFVGLRNYLEGIVSGNYPFYKAVINSVIITTLSTALILICTSMCAWYIVRVKSAPSKLFYYLCVISMVVPFQMVMYTLPKTADELYLNNPIGISIVYLGKSLK